MDKKYELTEETKELSGRTLHRIRALKDFSDVKKGELGGWIEAERNLFHEGECWVYDDACVMDVAIVGDNAKVSGNAVVYEFAVVYGNAKVYDNAIVDEFANVYGNAEVYEDAWINDYAKIYENAKVYGMSEVYDVAKVYGNAEVYGVSEVFEDCEVCDYAKVYGSTTIDSGIVCKETELAGGDFIMYNWEPIHIDINARLYARDFDPCLKREDKINSLYELIINTPLHEQANTSGQLIILEKDSKTFNINTDKPKKERDITKIIDRGRYYTDVLLKEKETRTYQVAKDLLNEIKNDLIDDEKED